MIFDEKRLQDLMRDAVREVLREERGATSRDEFLSTADAAKVASVAPETIRDWMSQGKLTRYRAGRQVRVDREELLRFLSRAVPEPRRDLADPATEARKFVARHHRKAG